MNGKVENVDWGKFGAEIVEKVSEALDYWAWNISGDSVIDAYSAHMDMDLYELAAEFCGWSYSGITENDLKLLEKMPEKVYQKYNELMKKEIERVVNELMEELGESEGGEL